LKPQDVVLLCKMLSWNNRTWRLIDLAQELNLSQGEISFGLERLKTSKLIDESKRHLFKGAILEFLVHGVKYFFPISPGSLERGMPTAHSAPPLNKKIITQENAQYVWADPEGDIRGQHLEPLYEGVPFAAKRDSKLYEYLALIEALRVGKSREQALATSTISKLIQAA
jgi:hypothetical protein